MLLSVQRWTPEWWLLRGKKAALLLDMGSVDPGCSSCGFPGYAAPSRQDRSERQYRGCSRASAGGHPKHIDGYHHRRPRATEEIECATPPFVGPSPEPDVIPLRAELGRRLNRCRKKDLRRLPTAQEPARVIRVSPARCWCPIRRLRKA